MRVKTCPAEIKSVWEGSGAGEFEALVSAFGNLDAVGDVVQKGAFVKSLASWATSGNPIPVIWSHDHSNPEAHIGVTTDAKETDAGLWVKGQLDLGEPYVDKVYRLMKGKRVTKFSFAYDVKDGTRNEKGGFDLKELDLWEVGPTLIPANDQTNLLEIKNLMKNEGFDFKELANILRELKEAGGSPAILGMKAGRVLSSKNEAALVEALATISDGVEKIKSVVSSVASADAMDGKEAQPVEANKKPAEGKADPVEDQKPADVAQPAKSDQPDDLKTRLELAEALANL